MHPDILKAIIDEHERELRSAIVKKAGLAR
jgi:hypothetical protein